MSLNVNIELSPDIVNKIIANSKKLPSLDLPGDFKLNRHIEHTLLKPQAQNFDFVTLAKQALDYNFYGVCIPPCRIKLLRDIVNGSSVKIITTIAFPLGSSTKLVKATESAYAQDDGADEIDMVINIGKLKESDFNYVYQDIAAVKSVLYPQTVLKVILETALLKPEEIIQGGFIALLAGADYLKTSTGFLGTGATVENVRILRSLINHYCQQHQNKPGIKASGGIKTGEFALQLIRAGADRLGTSSSLKLIESNQSQQ
ncbi:MAG: hypothetical protein APR63_07595 [Desulfuromonas sp. SDB]|nr:MAG: hypothetical protein APR63_07595 [Desulfuromonas sp. SDB]